MFTEKDKELAETELKLAQLELSLVKSIKKVQDNYKKITAVSFLFGVLAGCATMFLVHKDSIQHYNICQEQVLMDSISRIGDEKSWYIKEDAFGKIKLVQLSNKEIDSLNRK